MKNLNNISGQPQSEKDGFEIEISFAIKIMLAGMFWVLGLAQSVTSLFGGLIYARLCVQERIWAEDEDTVMGPIYRRRIEKRERVLQAVINLAERLQLLERARQSRFNMIASRIIFKAGKLITLMPGAKADSTHVLAPP